MSLGNADAEEQNQKAVSQALRGLTAKLPCSLVLFTPVYEPLFELTLGSVAFFVGGSRPLNP